MDSPDQQFGPIALALALARRRAARTARSSSRVSLCARPHACPCGTLQLSAGAPSPEQHSTAPRQTQCVPLWSARALAPGQAWCGRAPRRPRARARALGVLGAARARRRRQRAAVAGHHAQRAPQRGAAGCGRAAGRLGRGRAPLVRGQARQHLRAGRSPDPERTARVIPAVPTLRLA